ncbi:MAG: hypothetical protein AB2A00_36915 [Myxococcota bacterium]
MMKLQHVSLVLVVILGACSDGGTDESSSSSSTSSSSGGGGTSSSSGGSSSSSSGTPGTGPFACVGSVQPVVPSMPTVVKLFEFKDFGTGNALQGVNVKLCPVEDDACASPVDEGTTNEEGKVGLTIPVGTEGYQGYLELTSSQIMPTLYFNNRPWVDNAGFSLELLSPQSVATINALIGAELDPTRGHVGFNVYDCDNEGASGVSASVDTSDENSTQSYVSNGFPTTSTQQTDSSGKGGWANLPTGRATISYVQNASSVTVIQHRVLVKAGYFVAVSSRPR